MRLFIIYCVVLLLGCARFSTESDKKGVTVANKPDSTSSAEEVVSFADNIQPILNSRCQPCHFKGGSMYERLPFDTAATVYELGEELLTRIKDPEEQAQIKSFLAQQHAEK